MTAFVNMLAVMEQNPGTEWKALIGGFDVAEDAGDDMSDIDEAVGASAAPDAGDEDELAAFRL